MGEMQLSCPEEYGRAVALGRPRDREPLGICNALQTR
jgi:hypothetical protein